ncbi:hypothetical protein RVZ54_001509 [Listeria monocytogenes]|nr:hypothetical protein [Listeria monocytogenes]EDH0846602.1 hypothetical protein [Listeria monocytogenes]EDH0873756.1 hypothetical protein [Listeria monocytogenes]EDH0897789.1 hypothetical protein [Listeria monocytogenes]EDH0943306.1 hypothetical protein [Listeria monocytogenes]
MVAISGVSLVFAVLGMKDYAMSSDWWTSSENYDYSVDSFAGIITYILFTFIGLVNLALFTLFPTSLLKASVVVDGFIYKKYSEEFRKEYEFTDREWYGE